MTLQLLISSFFFFQAEDGIRDVAVTGVQTCALPICPIKKDKLFFFQSTEWLRVRSSATAIVAVPTRQLIAAANPTTQQFFSAFGTLRSNFIQLKTYTRGELGAAGITACPPSPSNCDTDFPVGSTTPMFAQGQYSVPADSGAGSPQNTDRKSTRLNSSHGYISYAVFCLKKKITITDICRLQTQ